LAAAPNWNFSRRPQPDVPDFAVLHLHGPGGMGKTTLLREFAHIATEAGRPSVSL
jgi:ABC-type cobalamin transport system ATPase subunit